MSLPQLKPYSQELPFHEFSTKQELLNCLGRSDQPVAVMLTCWELGGIPDQVSRAAPGEIMVAQNPGGLVRDVNKHGDGVTFDTIIYCLQQPTVRHLIVCGHTQCHTLAALFCDATEARMGAQRSLLNEVSQRLRANYSKRASSDWLRILAQEAVIQQLANLRSHSPIRSRLDGGSLFLHGWMRDDETSAISAFDPVSGQFCV